MKLRNSLSPLPENDDLVSLIRLAVFSLQLKFTDHIQKTSQYVKCITAKILKLIRVGVL
jgi:hypothetical protein